MLHHTGLPCTFTTRVHNESLPSPTLIFYPGNTYHIQLINKLYPESSSNPTELNVFKDPNTTNLHTHGLHLSGVKPADNIFTTVFPESTQIYTYEIPCNHFSGLFWYHPHHHGSTTLQVAGGAAGALIVEQPNNNRYSIVEGMPEWLYTMDELIIVIQRFPFYYLSTMFDSVDEDVDRLTSFERPPGGSCRDFITLNGKYQPDICLTTGEYKRLRLINTDYDDPVTLYLNYGDDDGVDSDDSDGSCELYLIARDGILLDNGPRDVSHIWLAPANRADVAIICWARDDDHESSTMYDIDITMQNGDIVGYLKVSGNTMKPDDESIAEYELTSFVPNRPNYMPDLRNYNGDFQEYRETTPGGNIITNSYWTARIGANTINGRSFEGEGEFQTRIQVGKVNEWYIERTTTTITHPFHIHVYPFQVVEGGYDGADSSQDIPVNWHQSGDYVSCLCTNLSVIYFEF